MTMDWAFTAADLIQIGILITAISAAYWRLSIRLSLVESKAEQLERDGRANESKLEQKLDKLSEKIDALIVEVTQLKTKADG